MDYTGLSGLSIKTVESVKSVPFFLTTHIFSNLHFIILNL